jgi:predicted nucleic acid-binding protein
MDWVLDASIALAWALPDETSLQADQFLSRVSGKDVLWVPSSWWYEVANALILAERRKRLTEANGIQLRELYGMLPIKTDMIIGPDTIERLRTLGREYRLSAYDATYLELALRKGLRLATLDQTLQSAARKAGVRILFGF